MAKSSDPSKFRVGHRNRAAATKSPGKLSQNRAAWCRVFIGEFIIMLNPPKNEEQIGTDIRLLLPQPHTRPISYHLTALTADELDSVERLFALIFQAARPVCEERDKVARDALKSGDDSDSRSYRQAPQFIVRSGEILTDHEGLRKRLEGVPPLDEEDSSSDGELRGSGDGVVESESEDAGSQDDGSSSE